MVLLNTGILKPQTERAIKKLGPAAERIVETGGVWLEEANTHDGEGRYTAGAPERTSRAGGALDPVSLRRFVLKVRFDYPTC